MSNRLIFFGTADFSADALSALIKAKFKIVAVVTKPDQPSGRGQKIALSAVKQLALKHKILLLQPAKLGEVVDQLVGLKPDLGIVVAYGKMIPLAALEAFPMGIVNIHGSLLPKHRGASPIEGAILSGDKQAGITLMQISEHMDGGPVYAEDKIDLDGTETRPVLYAKLSQLGSKLLVDKLPSILTGDLKPIHQDETKATYVKLIQKNDGDIDWSVPAEQIERQIRAYVGWPSSRATVAGTDVIITAAHIIPLAGKPGEVFKTEHKELAVYCGQQALVIDQLKPVGKTEMTGKEFLAGHRLA